jgi:hypothetical protein
MTDKELADFLRKLAREEVDYAADCQADGLRTLAKEHYANGDALERAARVVDEFSGVRPHRTLPSVAMGFVKGR